MNISNIINGLELNLPWAGKRVITNVMNVNRILAWIFYLATHNIMLTGTVTSLS